LATKKTGAKILDFDWSTNQRAARHFRALLGAQRYTFEKFSGVNLRSRIFFDKIFSTFFIFFDDPLARRFLVLRKIFIFFLI